MARLKLEEVQNAIKEKGAAWEAGETEIAPYLDLDTGDKRLFGLNLGRPEELTVGESVAEYSMPLPSSIDWRNVNGQNWVTEIRNQKTCSACVAFATCAVLESRAKWTQEDSDLPIDLSVAHLFFCGAGEACETGWEIDQALKFCRDYGVGREKNFPYTLGNQRCRQIRSVVKVSSWESGKSLHHRKQAIAQNGPVIAGMRIFEDLYYYCGGIYRHVTGGLRGLHAVAVIGYNDQQKYWIVKNSWGTGWGDKGFMLIDYGELDTEFYFYDPYVNYLGLASGSVT